MTWLANNVPCKPVSGATPTKPLWRFQRPRWQCRWPRWQFRVARQIYHPSTFSLPFICEPVCNACSSALCFLFCTTLLPIFCRCVCGLVDPFVFYCVLDRLMTVVVGNNKRVCVCASKTNTARQFGNLTFEPGVGDF